MQKFFSKKNLLYCLFSVLCSIAEGQTFSNTTIAAANSWNTTLVRTFSVSGLSTPLGSGNTELVQVNIHMGRLADGTYNFSRYNITLQSPSGTTIKIVNGNPNVAPWTFPNLSLREFDCKFRDNQYLRLPDEFGGGSCQPWHIGYYRTTNANAFSAFNGEDPNGDWTLTITENSASSGVRFNDAAIVFAQPYTETDYTFYTQNDNCTTPFCLRPSDVIIATNYNFTNQGTDLYDPNTTPATCDWNSAQNASAWFKFIADATNVTITVSGISNSMQILGVSSTNQCSAALTTVLSGGCPTEATNDNYHDGAVYSNGSDNNMQLNMSGLTVGQTYYFIIDGQGVVTSPFYIEISGASELCSDVLPVEMLDFRAGCQENGKPLITWETASEINNQSFSLLRSEGGGPFETIAKIPGAGNSNSVTSYAYQDSGTTLFPVYYRLKQTDYNGVFSYIGETFADCSDLIIENSIKASYNQENSSIEIEIPECRENLIQITIMDVNGRSTYSINELVQEKHYSHSVPINDWKKGVYFITISGMNYPFSKKIFIF